MPMSYCCVAYSNVLMLFMCSEVTTLWWDSNVYVTVIDITCIIII